VCSTFGGTIPPNVEHPAGCPSSPPFDQVGLAGA
jgi:hypothetical protein